MKIKGVCKKTELTERTVRFYVEKGLVLPVSQEMNGRTYYEYSEEDVTRLLRIAALRKTGFTIESILEMQGCPDKIDNILRTQFYMMMETEEKTLQLIHLLEVVKNEHFSTIEDLANRLILPTISVELPAMDIKPDFGRFDSETPGEKEKAIQNYLYRNSDEGKKKRKHLLLVKLLITVLSILLLGSSFWNAYTLCQNHRQLNNIELCIHKDIENHQGAFGWIIPTYHESGFTADDFYEDIQDPSRLSYVISSLRQSLSFYEQANSLIKANSQYFHGSNLEVTDLYRCYIEQMERYQICYAKKDFSNYEYDINEVLQDLLTLCDWLTHKNNSKDFHFYTGDEIKKEVYNKLISGVQKRGFLGMH